MKRMYSGLIVVAVIIGIGFTTSALAHQRSDISRVFKMPREQLDEAAGIPVDDEFRGHVEVSAVSSDIRGLEVKNKPGSKHLPVVFPMQKKESIPVNELEKTILELSIQEAELAEKFGKDHPKLKALRHKIEMTEKMLKTKQHLTERDEHKKRKLREEDEEAREIERRRNNERDFPRRGFDGGREHGERDRRNPDEHEHEHREHREQHEEHQMRKVHALHEAAERLAAGGLEDEAHHLHRRAEELEEELHHHREGHHEPEHVIHELLENVQSLRREVRETHEKLDRILEMLHDHENDDGDDDEVNLRGNRNLIRPVSIRPVWWDEDSMKAREETRRRLATEQAFIFGGVTINR